MKTEAKLKTTIKGIVKAIDKFDKQCAKKEYTDTGDAWDLLNSIRTTLKGEL